MVRESNPPELSALICPLTDTSHLLSGVSINLISGATRADLTGVAWMEGGPCDWIRENEGKKREETR